MSKILQHPLLANPIKHIKNIPKKHDSSLYTSNIYPCIEKNPHAISLAYNVGLYSKLRACQGNVIPISIKPTGFNQHELFPLFNKVDFSSIRYMENNEGIIKYSIMGKQFGKYVPLNYSRRNGIDKRHNVSFTHDFTEKVEQYYRDRINELVKKVDKNDSGEYGVLVTDVKGIQVKQGITLVDKSIVGIDQMFIDYTKHSELAMLLVKLVDYKSI